LEAERAREKVVRRGGGRQRRVKFNHDGVDVQLKLRSPSKITFDIHTCNSDDKIKNWIILGVL
jgi:hypothetical protein